LAERGFNQAALLASPVARELGARFAPRGLTRLRATREQAGLERAERLENVLGAFVATRRLDGARVALVDDVLTTGATLEAAATALHDAGASSVLYVVVGVASA
jgi:predicted amidophosphoribosyltransferase